MDISNDGSNEEPIKEKNYFANISKVPQEGRDKSFVPVLVLNITIKQETNSILILTLGRNMIA